MIIITYENECIHFRNYIILFVLREDILHITKKSIINDEKILINIRSTQSMFFIVRM